MDKKQDKRPNGWHGKMLKRTDTVARWIALSECIKNGAVTLLEAISPSAKKNEEPQQPKDYDTKHGRK